MPRTLIGLMTGALLLSSLLGTEISAQEAVPVATDSLQVLIKRDAISLISPDTFRIPLSLKAARSIELRARVEGVVQNVRVQPGAKVSAQEELIRIESAQAAKSLDRARAGVKAATLRRDLANTEVTSGQQPQLSLDLANAVLDVAKAELDLAQMNYDQTSARAPFAGIVNSCSAVTGAFVSEGDLLLELSDPESLSVQIPVDRNQVKVGDAFNVQLDSGIAPGKVQAILPLDSQWQRLRQLVDTAALAVVVIDNKAGAYQPGQTVYSPIVPRQPILEVANLTLKNSETGKRIVQVLRDLVVRDIEVQLLGPVGEGRSYVAGPFQADDEVIHESSVPLLDGTVVRPNNVAAPATTPGVPRRGGPTVVNPNQ